jgi:undecaprenyl pyrophosphate phosphatase UppP
MISYLQAVLIGLLQGVTELFPVSSLGHSVLVPAFIGGSWETLVTQSATSTSETSPYLAVIVALHVATALALIIFFRSDWVRIITGFARTIRPSFLRAASRHHRCRRTYRLAAYHRHHPGRHHRAGPRTHLPHPVRQTAGRRHLPHD